MLRLYVRHYTDFDSTMGVHLVHSRVSRIRSGNARKNWIDILDELEDRIVVCGMRK